MYHPFRDGPFDVLDFPEFIPLMRHGRTFLGRVAEMDRYYASLGRLNTLTYVIQAAKWSMFGWNASVWQGLRGALMVVNVALLYTLLRRMGNVRLAAATSSLLMLCAAAAAESWIRLTMGEPIGVFLLLLASLLATRFQENDRWPAIASGIAVLLAAMILAKEMLVTSVPFVVGIALLRRGDRLSLPERVGRRDIWLVAVVTGVTAVTIAAVAATMFGASSGTFVSSYGAASPAIVRFVVLLGASVLPVVPDVAPGPTIWLVGNLPYLIVLAIGWRAALASTAPSRRSAWLALALAAIIPVLGVASYLPWPYFNMFYGLPMLVGAALLGATALTAIERSIPRGRVVAYVACAFSLIVASTQAHHMAESAYARRLTNERLARLLPTVPPSDVVVGSVDLPQQVWQGWAATIRRYAAVTDTVSSLPAMRDVTCATADSLRAAAPATTTIIDFSVRCGTRPWPTTRIVRYYTFLHIPSFTTREDSIRVDVTTLHPHPGGIRHSVPRVD